MSTRAGTDPDADETWNFDAPEPVEDDSVAFRPNPGPQTDFLASDEREVLYGGAAGGGKSMALLADPTRYFTNPKFSGLLLRRTTDDLRELQWNAFMLYPRVFGDQIKWSERKQNWSMETGARFWMTYLDRDDDVRRYQGQAFTWIGFDELTQWPTPFPWEYLRSRLRTTARDLPLHMRASTNPGDVGAWWVKKMFVDPAPPNTPFWARDLETGEILRYPVKTVNGKKHPKAGQPLFLRKFVPAKLYDNPYLTADGEYETNLMSLPEIQRKQLLEGSWDTVEGAAFPEFDRKVHVTKPFEIPRNWRRFRGLDYGYQSFSAVVWFAIHPSGQLIVYRELEVKKVLADDLADMIYELEQSANEYVPYGIADGHIFKHEGNRGPTIGESLQRNGLIWRKADKTKGSRKAGKNEFHKRLRVDPETGEPGIIWFNTCTQSIAQIPMLQLDKIDPEDVDTKGRDHIYDATRYGIMSRPAGGYAYNTRKYDVLDFQQDWTPADATLGY